MPRTCFGFQEPSVTTEVFGSHGVRMRLAGELDLAFAANLEDAIDGEIRRGHRHLVIDLSAATFLDCAVIGALLKAVAPLRNETDAAIVLAGPTGIVKRLIDLLHLDRFFDIVPDVDQAAEHAIAIDRPHVDGWRSASQGKLVAEPPMGRTQPAAADAPPPWR